MQDKNKESTYRLIYDFVERNAPRLQLPSLADEWLELAHDLRAHTRELLLRSHPPDAVEASVPVEWTKTLETSPEYRIRKPGKLES